MASYRNDPRWITVKFGSPVCTRCKTTIRKGSEAFYYPNDKTMLCAGESCGKQESRNFQAASFDEDVMSSQFGGY